MDALMVTAFPEKTTIVYLDQNMWIYLSQAYYGLSNGKKYHHVLAKIQTAVSNKTAIFPLSFQHYIETNQNSDLEQRRRLARVMAEISQGIAISPQEIMMQWELEKSLAKLFNEPAPEPPPVFGYGIPYAFGFSFIVKDQNGNRVPKNQLEEIRDKITSPNATLSLLVEDGDDEFNNWAREFQKSHNDLAEKLESFRAKVRKLDKSLRKRAYAVHLNIALEDEIIKALGYFNKTYEEFLSIGAERLMAFWETVPTLDLEIELNVGRNEHWDRRVEPNDATDIAFLNVAIPYCNVIVLERYFCNLVKKRKLDKKYDTVVLKDLNELIPILS